MSGILVERAGGKPDGQKGEDGGGGPAVGKPNNKKLTYNDTCMWVPSNVFVKHVLGICVWGSMLGLSMWQPWELRYT